MKDVRGVERGQCLNCPCPEFMGTARSPSARCDYCDCVAMRHIEGGEEPESKTPKLEASENSENNHGHEELSLVCADQGAGISEDKFETDSTEPPEPPAETRESSDVSERESIDAGKLYT